MPKKNPSKNEKTPSATPKQESTVGFPLFWIVGALIATAALYWDVLRWLASVWDSNPDYSHGYVVPLFSAYILWANRARFQTSVSAASSGTIFAGILLLVVGLGLRASGIYFRILTLEAASLLPFLMGAVTILLGFTGLRWAIPGILFLAFMFPLPGALSGQLSGLLQSLATTVSTFTLQTLGVPAFSEGNVITLSQGKIGVAEACSGLRMLYAFFALTVGACMVIDRTWIEKILIAVSAIPIAIVSNCIRIVATGMAYEYTDQETAEHLFHDVAGWLMMPLGFAILLVVLAIFDRLIVPEESFPTANRRT